MRKILWIKQSFHIPYDMNLLNKTFQFNYKWLFVDKNHKIQPLRLSRDLILQGPKVLVGTPVVMGTRELVPAKFWKPLARLSNIFTRLIVSDIVIYIQKSTNHRFKACLEQSISQFLVSCAHFMEIGCCWIPTPWIAFRNHPTIG